MNKVKINNNSVYLAWTDASPLHDQLTASIQPIQEQLPAPHFIQEEKEHKESRHATAKKATSATEEITEAASAHSSANQTSASLSTSTQGIRSELIQRQGQTQHQSTKKSSGEITIGIVAGRKLRLTALEVAAALIGSSFSLIITTSIPLQDLLTKPVRIYHPLFFRPQQLLSYEKGLSTT